MPFQLPALPNFGAAIPPQSSPLETYGKMLQLKALQGSLAMQPMQMQAEQQKVEQMKTANQMAGIELAAKQAYNRYWSNPDDFSGEAPHKDALAAMLGLQSDDPLLATIGGEIKAGVPADHAIADAMHTLEFRKTNAQATQERQKVHQSAIQEMSKISASILAEKDPAKKALLINQKLPGLAAAAQYDPSFGPVIQQLTAANFDAFANRLGAEKDALEYQKEQLAGKKAEQGIINPKTGISPEQEAEARKQIAVETNPAVIQARVGQAVSTEVAKQKALAPQLGQIVSTTRSGRQYIDRENVPKGSEGVVEQAAAKSGIPVLEKDSAATLVEIDTAKANQQTMLDLIGKKLATSAGERIYKGPANKLEAAMQTDPDLAAMGTFRNAAIQSMRAVAGSKGLRINQYEVQLAIDNDIPKMTDTWDVAAAKVRNLSKFLDNTETAHLVRNRAQPGGGGGTVAGGGGTGAGGQEQHPLDKFWK